MNKRRSKKAYRKWLAMKPLTRAEYAAVSRYVSRYKVRIGDIPDRLSKALGVLSDVIHEAVSQAADSLSSLVSGMDIGLGSDQTVVVEVRKQLPVKNEPFSMGYKVVSR